MDRATVASIAWFGPRGLATVAFGLIAYHELIAEDGTTTVLAAVVATVLLSVLTHGLTARPLGGKYAATQATPSADTGPKPLTPRKLFGHLRTAPPTGAEGPLL